MNPGKPDLTITPYQGYSMQPTLKPEDLILWRRHEPSLPIRVGDVVGYFVGNRLVAHRVLLVDIEQDTLVTRGDGNLFADPPVARDAVRYVGVAAWRGNRLIDLNSRRDLHRWVRPLARELRRVAGAGLRRLTF